MISIMNVNKRIANFFLDDISVTIPDGYICGLVGRNGSGKTSLINLMLGLYKKDSGKIEVDDLNYDEHEIMIRNSLGFVLDEDLLKVSMKLDDNGKTYGMYYDNYNHDEYLDLLQEFGLNKKKIFGDLSRGEKLKAQFAFALACNPKYLILDEPTANFDPEYKQLFMEKLREFVAKQNNSVILATHITSELENIADYIIYIDNGKIIFQGDIEQFRDNYRVVSGERYKINLLEKDDVIGLDEREYSCKALVRYRKHKDYPKELAITYPTIEEFMYLYSKK